MPNFVRVKTFLVQFIHQFDPDTHFSVITFAKTPTVRCKFADRQCQSTDGTHDLISEIPDELRWGTRTDLAFKAADQSFTPKNGERADASNVVVVITDGKAQKGSAPYNVTVPLLRVCLVILIIKLGIIFLSFGLSPPQKFLQWRNDHNTAKRERNQINLKIGGTLVLSVLCFSPQAIRRLLNCSIYFDYQTSLCGGERSVRNVWADFAIADHELSNNVKMF